MTGEEPVYLTVKEVAALLRISERSAYSLAASGEIPCSKATGKLLFPRDAVKLWIESHLGGGTGAGVRRASSSLTTVAPSTELTSRQEKYSGRSFSATPPVRPTVVVGSHDPLLEWALRQSQSGMASFLDGSQDGLERFARFEAAATGLHLYDRDTETWNVSAVVGQFADEPVVLLHWAWRQRGVILSAALEGEISDIRDLSGYRLVARQVPSGGHSAMLSLISAYHLEQTDFEWSEEPARSELDVATMLQVGQADAGFGLQSVAQQMGLPFIPLMWECFDLLVDRRAAFEPGMQALFAFARSRAFASQASRLGGYRIDELGMVKFNGP